MGMVGELAKTGAGFGEEFQGWGWRGNPTYTSALGPSDLKLHPQACKAPTAPSVVPPVVDQVQPVMAPSSPAAPGRMGWWDYEVGT